jgi:hypothetical protein
LPASATAGIHGQIEFALIDRARHDGHGQVRPDNTGQDIDLVGLDHLVRQLHGDIRLALIVLDDDFDVLVSGLLDCQHETVACIDAESRAAAGKRRDHADLDRLRDGCRGHSENRQGGKRFGDHFHIVSLQ